MHGRLGFTDGADNNMDAQGIDLVKELGYLNDDDVSNLCRTIRRPGGHVANPAFVAGVAPVAPPAVAVPLTRSPTRSVSSATIFCFVPSAPAAASFATAIALHSLAPIQLWGLDHPPACCSLRVVIAFHAI